MRGMTASTPGGMPAMMRMTMTAWRMLKAAMIRQGTQESIFNKSLFFFT